MSFEIKGVQNLKLDLPPGPRIALMSRALFSYHSQVVWGFIKKIEEHEELTWKPILFGCKEPREDVMRAQMKEIKRDGYDLVLTVGALYSATAVEAIRNNIFDVPLVYSGVTDPVKMNLIPALEPERLITGIVREQVPYTYLADFIHFIRPRTKRVLVPFYQNAEFGLYQERLELLRARFAEFGVETILLPVRAMTEVIPAVAEYMSSIDTIILPEGTFISDVTNAIADLCKQYKVMLVGHHIERTGSNPAVTFLQDAEKVGEALFDAAYQILEQGKKPSEMPIVHLPDDRQIIIDHNACYDQGVDADAIALFCANNNIIIP